MTAVSVSVQFFAERILNSIPEGILIAAAAWLVARLVGAQNSRIRFAVWFIALLAIVLVPFIPATHVASSFSPKPAELTLPAWTALALGAAWLAVAMFALLRIAYGLTRLRRLRDHAVPFGAIEVDHSRRNSIEQVKAGRAFDIKVSAEVRVPTAIGFFKPTILLPEWTLRDLSSEELSNVLLHERAHLRRRDDWTNLAQKLLRALFFFHPGVLWAEKSLSIEREMACDDLVLATTGNPESYAKCLVSLAEKSFVRRTITLAQAAIGRARETSLRVSKILSRDRGEAKGILRPALAGSAAVVLITLVAVPNVPQLIAFQSGSDTAMQTAELRQPAVPKSMVVPAMARMDGRDAAVARPAISATQHRAASRSASSSVDRKIRNEHAEPETIARATNRRSLGEPRVVSARLAEPPQQMLLVTQTTDYYQQGADVVGVTEWHVVVVNVPVSRTNSAQPPKRT